MEVETLRLLIAEHLERFGSERASQLEPLEGLQPKDWVEGVEHLKDATIGDLWLRLGFPSQRIPGITSKIDPDGLYSSTDKKPWKALEDSGGLQDLDIRWHQLVGIYRLLELFFDGKPALLMDGVGLGKTLTVIGFAAALSAYRLAFKANGAFPGDFST